MTRRRSFEEKLKIVDDYLEHGDDRSIVLLQSELVKTEGLPVLRRSRHLATYLLH